MAPFGSATDAFELVDSARRFENWGVPCALVLGLGEPEAGRASQLFGVDRWNAAHGLSRRHAPYGTVPGCSGWLTGSSRVRRRSRPCPAITTGPSISSTRSRDRLDT